VRAEDLPVVVMKGTPHERGQSYGEHLRGRVRETVAKYCEWLAAVHCRDARARVTDLARRASFEPHIQRYCPDLADEVRGIAEGASLPVADVLALNLLDETDAQLAGLTVGQDRPLTGDRCSAVAMRSANEGVTVGGQNMDIAAWCEGSQVLLRMAIEGEVEQLVFSIAGSIGLNGMNAYGLGVSLNALPTLPSSPDGLPVTFVLRCLLRQRDVASAVQFLRSIRHASGQNYLLSGRDEIASIECSAERVARVGYEGLQDRLIHTNHPLASPGELRNVESDSQTGTYGTSASSQARYSSLDRRMKRADACASVEFLKETFRAKDDPLHPVCRATLNKDDLAGYTVGSSIYEVPHRGAPRMHLYPGPPDSGEYHVLDFEMPLGLHG